MYQQRIITIYTDASICGTTDCAAWGAWVKHAEGESFTLSKVFKKKIKCTTSAELMAMANALFVVIKKLQPEKTKFVIVTDCEQAMNIINGVTSINKNHNKIKQYIMGIIPPGCDIKVNKVKAHTGNDDCRSYINNVVDKLAKKAMREARKNESTTHIN